MKIDDNISNYTIHHPGEKAKTALKAPDNISSTVSLTTRDSVTISPDATKMSEDEARRERLDLIRKQLSEGTYNISGKDVADKMLNVLKS